jgi:hypothetical protein
LPSGHWQRQKVINGLVVELGDNPRGNFKRRLQDEYNIIQICPDLQMVRRN